MAQQLILHRNNQAQDDMEATNEQLFNSDEQSKIDNQHSQGTFVEHLVNLKITHPHLAQDTLISHHKVSEDLANLLVL